MTVEQMIEIARPHDEGLALFSALQSGNMRELREEMEIIGRDFFRANETPSWWIACKIFGYDFDETEFMFWFGNAN